MMFGRRKDRIYISGAVTTDPDFREKFSSAEKFVRAYGLEPLNPVRGEKDGKSWEYYIRKDLRKLLRCDGIALLSDWKRSRGATLERSVAEALGMKVYFLDLRRGILDLWRR